MSLHQLQASRCSQVERMVPADVRFCVEDITDGDPRRVGVRWCALRAGGLHVLPLAGPDLRTRMPSLVHLAPAP